MNSITTKVAAAFLVTTMGLSAIAPALAQEAPPAPGGDVSQSETLPNEHAFRGHGGPRGGIGFLDFARGAEGIEVALVRLAHRVDLTAEQQTLLDTLKTTAVAAAEDFATATDGLRPTRPAEGERPAMPSMAELLDNRIAIETAHVAALEAVQPAAVAFFDSLTDEQKAQLMPERGDGGPRGQHGGGHPQGPRGFGGGHR